MKAPCYGCGEREEGCHTECGRYSKFREKCEKLREARKAETDATMTKLDRINRTTKKGGWSWKRDEKRDKN